MITISIKSILTYIYVIFFCSFYLVLLSSETLCKLLKTYRFQASSFSLSPINWQIPRSNLKILQSLFTETSIVLQEKLPAYRTELSILNCVSFSLFYSKKFIDHKIVILEQFPFTHPSINGTSLRILRAAASRSPAWAASKILVSSWPRTITPTTILILLLAGPAALPY